MELKINDDFTTAQAFVVELVGGYILSWAIISCGEHKAARNSTALGPSAALFIIISGVGYVSGGGFNPALAFGFNVSDAFNHGWDRLDDFIIYLAAPAIGGVIAGLWHFVMIPGFRAKWDDPSEYEAPQDKTVNEKVTAQGSPSKQGSPRRGNSNRYDATSSEVVPITKSPSRR